MSRLARTLCALAALAAGCAGTQTQPTPECQSAKCDETIDALLLICGAREAATGESGCAESSSTEIGIDGDIPRIDAEIQVVARGLDGAETSLVIYDGERIVRRIALENLSDGPHTLSWDGRDDDGRDITASFHRVRLEATIGGRAVASNEHEVYSLISLPDSGPGYYHTLGTDAKDSDDWGRLYVIDALTQVGAAWQHPYRIGYGDLSLQNGGEFAPHNYHRRGVSVDIRYVRTDREGALDLRWDKAKFDRDATLELIDLLFARGAIEIYVDERSDISGERIVYVDGHSNHLHAVFPLREGDTGLTRAVNEGFTGGPCFDNSDCGWKESFCRLKESGVGTCTMPCSDLCSDFRGGIYTLSECVELDANLCMPARDYERYPDSGGCRADLQPQELASADQAGARTEVCVP